MSTFPSILTSYTNPTPTNRLNAPSHSSIESAQNSGLSQLEDVIGVEGANSVVGSFQYIIKSPASNGGGHTQSANTGGTGQTSFTKGDTLVASSSSVLSKLSVGTDGQFISADSTQPTGIRWVNNAPIIGFVTTPISVLNTTAVTPVYSSVLTTGFFGANTGVRVKGNCSIQWTQNQGPTVTAAVNYNSSVVGMINLSPSYNVSGGGNNLLSFNGNWEIDVMNMNNKSSQLSVSQVLLTCKNLGLTPQTSYADTSTSIVGNYVDTSVPVTLSVTYSNQFASVGGGVFSKSVIVEKISQTSP